MEIPCKSWVETSRGSGRKDRKPKTSFRWACVLFRSLSARLRAWDSVREEQEQIGCGQHWQQLARSLLRSTNSDVYAHVHAGVKEDDPVWVTSCSRSPSASCGHLQPGAKWKLRQGGERKHRYRIGKQTEQSFHFIYFPVKAQVTLNDYDLNDYANHTSARSICGCEQTHRAHSQVTLLSLTADFL